MDISKIRSLTYNTSSSWEKRLRCVETLIKLDKTYYLITTRNNTLTDNNDQGEKNLIFLSFNSDDVFKRNFHNICRDYTGYIYS